MKKTTPLLLAAAFLTAVITPACKTHEKNHSSSNSSTISNTSNSSNSSSKTSTSTASKQNAKPVSASSKTSANSMMRASSMAFPTGDESTSAILLEKFVPREVTANQNFDYEIVVTNLTGLSLDNVIIDETIPANFQVASTTPANSSSAQGAGKFSLGTLGAHEARSVRVTGKATAPGSIDTCSSVSYESGLCASVPVVQPALKVVATGPATKSICDEICYQYTVTNTGSGMARNVVVSGRLPEGMKTDKTSGPFSVRVGDLEAGESKPLEICVEATRKGSFTHRVNAAADGGLTAESADVTTMVKEPVLTITKTGPERTYGGRNINYEITVSNVGDGIAEDVTVVDTLPQGVVFKSASQGVKPKAGKLTWKLGSLAPGASTVLQASVKADEHGKVTNVARATDSCAKPVQASVTTDVVGIPAILLEVVDVEDPIEIGENATYVITVTNQGTAPGHDIGIDVVLPPNVSYVSSTGANAAMGAGKLSGDRLNFPKLPVLAAKAEVSYRVVVKAQGAADARFKVSMTSRELTSPVEETEATNYYE